MGQCGVRISPPAPQSTWPCPVKQTTLHTLTWVTLSQSQTQLVRLKGTRWPASHGLATPLQQWRVCLAKKSPLALVQGAAADPEMQEPQRTGAFPQTPLQNLSPHHAHSIPPSFQGPATDPSPSVPAQLSSLHPTPKHGLEEEAEVGQQRPREADGTLSHCPHGVPEVPHDVSIEDEKSYNPLHTDHTHIPQRAHSQWKRRQETANLPCWKTSAKREEK